MNHYITISLHTMNHYITISLHTMNHYITISLHTMNHYLTISLHTMNHYLTISQSQNTPHNLVLTFNPCLSGRATRGLHLIIANCLLRSSTEQYRTVQNSLDPTVVEEGRQILTADNRLLCSETVWYCKVSENSQFSLKLMLL